MKKFTLIFFVFLLTGCADNSFTLDLSNVTTGETPTVTPAIKYENWTKVQSGVEFKQMLIGTGATTELVDIVKIDQTQAKLNLTLDETAPQTVSTWAKSLNASVIVNGSYFDEQYNVITRTIVDDKAEGKILSGPTGLAEYSVADGWTINAWAGENFTASTALQSYPLLLNDGNIFSGGSTDTAQRSVLAQAEDGTLYIIIAEYGVWSLQDLAQALNSEIEPNLRYALNLDGGTSTGLFVSGADVTFLDDSLPVPSVLYILPPNTL
ncbi:MAG: hypothetical protein ACD_43C00168G0003 [uncultured bacterium]|nr:MAG: hypothetical protein ACD_43C00168G0003 [uncultured bacterium]